MLRGITRRACLTLISKRSQWNQIPIIRSRQVATVDLYRGYEANGLQLLRLVLDAAIHAPRAMELVKKMLDLSGTTQDLLMDIIRDVNQ